MHVCMCVCNRNLWRFRYSQWKSPFDTCPCTTSPISLINLQVSVGGQNVLQSTLQYGYEHFLEQVNLAEQLTSSDFGISTGWFPHSKLLGK